MNLRGGAKATLDPLNFQYLLECIICVFMLLFLIAGSLFCPAYLFLCCQHSGVILFIFLYVTIPILKNLYKRCLACFVQYSACYFVQTDPWYLWGKTLSWATLKLSTNGQWQIFQQVVTYFPSIFSLSSGIAPLTLKCFTNGNSPIFTSFLWNTIVMRRPAIFWEAGEEKEVHRQLFISSVKIRGENCLGLHFRFNYFRTLISFSSPIIG